LFSSCVSYWEYGLSLESAPRYTPFDVMAIIVVVANHLSINLPKNLKQKWNQLAH